MTEPAPRPETVEDLSDYNREPVQLARITLDSSAIGNGLGSAVDTFIGFLRKTYGSGLIVETSNEHVVASRPRNSEELTKALKAAQRTWDDANKERLAAEARAALTVGDEYDPGRVITACEKIYKTRPCSLDYDHQGDHIKVVDGRVTEITPR